MKRTTDHKDARCFANFRLQSGHVQTYSSTPPYTPPLHEDFVFHSYNSLSSFFRPPQSLPTPFSLLGHASGRNAKFHADLSGMLAFRWTSRDLFSSFCEAFCTQRTVNILFVCFFVLQRVHGASHLTQMALRRRTLRKVSTSQMSTDAPPLRTAVLSFLPEDNATSIKTELHGTLVQTPWSCRGFS